MRRTLRGEPLANPLEKIYIYIYIYIWKMLWVLLVDSRGILPVLHKI
jgi:hypothetical protein